MLIYPFSAPIILNNINFSQYGGLGTGSFTSFQLQSSYWLAEMQVSAYLGTLLLPTNVTGTYPFLGTKRLVTDYGYVHQLYAVNVLSKQSYSNCNLQSNAGCAFIYEDTFGYVDFKQLSSVCGCVYGGFPFTPYVGVNYPYQIQLSYQAGLPTGTANQPGIMEALTILAQIDLNDKSPGQVGLNESVGDVGIQEFRSLDYFEKRAEHALVKTALGDSAKAMRARKLLAVTVRRAVRPLFA